MPLPRRVPKELLRAAQRQRAPVTLAVIGGGFVALGAILVGLLFPWNYARDRQLAATDTASALGRVLTVADTHLTISKRRVVRYEFSFEPAAGGTIQGECFTTGRRWLEGMAVPVRYRTEDPAVCCLAGARSSKSDASGMFLPLFPFLGGIFLVWFRAARSRVRRLLEHGLLAEALVIAVVASALQPSRAGRNVHKITVRRTDSPSGGNFRLRTTQTEVIDFALDRLETQQPVYVLYDPAQPKIAILPETL